MKRSYATEPNKEQYPPEVGQALFSMNLMVLKSLADTHAVQFDMTIKTDGIKVTIIKKNPDKTVRKRTVEIDNKDLGHIWVMVQNALNEILVTSQCYVAAMPNQLSTGLF